MDPVSTALQKRKLVKKSELARELRDTTTFQDIGQRTLEAYLGKLQHGDRGWWEKRPALMDAFANHADLEPSDLGFRPRTLSKSHEFPGFPALRSLDLAKESPPVIHNDVPLWQDSKWRDSRFDANFWLDPAAYRGPHTPQPGIYWLQIPRGSGLDLLWEQLLAQDRMQCIETDFFDSDLLHQFGRPMILRITQPVDPGKLEAVSTADARSAVLVLSRHAPPAPADHHVPLFTFQITRAFHSRPEGAMRRELDANWRDKLMVWILDRLSGPNTLLSQEDVERWIGKLVPWHSTVRTPRAFIAVCGLLHRLDPRKTGKFLKQEGGDELLKACLDNCIHADRLGKALRHRYVNGSGSWREPLLPEQWIAHLDVGLPHSTSINTSMAAVVKGKTEKQRRQTADDLLHEWSRASLVELVGEFGLEQREDGRYQMQLEFVADLMAADEVSDRLNRGQIADWARFYLDPSRRQAVEIALWRRAFSDLVRDTEYVLSLDDEPIHQIAAEEALFWIIGLKLAQPTTCVSAVDLAVLQSLAERNMARMRHTNSRLWTRDMRAPDEALTGLTVCWAWSLTVDLPSSRGNFVCEMPWQFPGWVAPSDLNASPVDSLSYESGVALDFTGGPPGREAWLIWWPVAQKVIDRLEVAPSSPPKALMPELLLWALREERQIEPDWLVVTSQISSEIIRKQFKKLDSRTKERLLDALLDTLNVNLYDVGSTDEEKANSRSLRSIEVDWLATSWLARETLKGLDSETCIRIARPERFGLLLQCLDHESRTVVAALARAIPVQPEWGDILIQLLRFEPADSWQCAAAWIDTILSAELAAWLWREDPHATLRLLTTTKELSVFAAISLTDNVPDEQIATVADFLAASELPYLQQSRLAWATERLPVHGAKLANLIDAITRADSGLTSA